MSNFITSQNGKDAYGLVEYFVDTVADIATLDTDCAVGSTCICLEDKNLYILDSSKHWQLFS